MKIKTIKQIGLLVLAAIIAAGSIGAYLWFKPHRNVEATEAFAALKVSDLTNEFSNDVKAANEKYLSADGNSKVLIVGGRVTNISTNQSGEAVIVLKDEEAKAGVSATFTPKTSPGVSGIKIGDRIKVKGVITAGNSYNADLDLTEHATLIQCDIVN